MISSRPRHRRSHVDADSRRRRGRGSRARRRRHPAASRTRCTSATSATLHTSADRARRRPVAVRLRDPRRARRSSTLLLGVTGVGPKSALGVLADAHAWRRSPRPSPPTTTRRSARCRASARRPRSSSSCQLAGKLAPPRVRHRTGARRRAATCPRRSSQALVGLGWSERVAAEAVDDGRRGRRATPTARRSPALLRLTLAALGPARRERRR